MGATRICFNINKQFFISRSFRYNLNYDVQYTLQELKEILAQPLLVVSLVYQASLYLI